MAELVNSTNYEFEGDLTQEQLNEAAKHLNILGSPQLVTDNSLFDFECQQCGACCMHRQDIILNAFDIYTAAKYLGITCREFIEKFTVRSLGGQSKIPMIILATDEQSGYCPFLEFDYIGRGAFKCKIHNAKPGACRSHPIGLMSQLDMDDEGNTKSIKTNYIKVEQCQQSKTGKMNRVGDWMSYYKAHEEETLKAHQVTILTNSIVNWREFFLITGVFTMAAKKKHVDTSNDLMVQAFNMMASLLIEYGYAHFDTDKDFCVQCDENRDFLSNRFTEIMDTMFPAACELFKETTGITVEEAIKMAETEDIESVIVKIGADCTYQGVDLDFEEDSDDSD